MNTLFFIQETFEVYILKVVHAVASLFFSLSLFLGELESKVFTFAKLPIVGADLLLMLLLRSS